MASSQYLPPNVIPILQLQFYYQTSHLNMFLYAQSVFEN